MNPSKRRAVLLAVAVVAFGVAPAAWSANLTVVPTGDDASDCRTAPCATFARAYEVAVQGDVVDVAPGRYGPQSLPAGTKAVTFRGAPGASIEQLDNTASNVVFDGLDIDGRFARQSTFQNHDAANVTFKNGRIGNVTDEKGALVSGENFTFDNVEFHDVVLRTPGVHLECVYAIGVPGMTVRNSFFHDCAIMDLFFTYGSWWTPKPPAYGGITLENNVFAHPESDGGEDWHYYGLYVADTGPNGEAGDPMNGWTVRNNTFETEAFLSSSSGTNGTRWVGNVGNWSCLSGVIFRYNVGKKCSATDKAVTPASSNATTTAGQGWVNPAAYDFHLKPGAPAIGAADPTDFPALDRDGNQRDAQPDAGAYEYGAKPPGSHPATPAPATSTPLTQTTRWRMRSVKLRTRTVCRVPRRGCPGSATLRLRLGRPARLSVAVQRARKGSKPKVSRRVARNRVLRHRAVRIRARGLQPGRYRLVVVAIDGAGRRSQPVRLTLRVR